MVPIATILNLRFTILLPNLLLNQFMLLLDQVPDLQAVLLLLKPGFLGAAALLEASV